MAVVQCRFVVLDVMGVELFFLGRTVSGSGAPGRFCETLPPSPSDLGDILMIPFDPKKKNSNLSGHCHTSPGDVSGTRGRLYSIFILLTVWSGELSTESEKLGETW